MNTKRRTKLELTWIGKETRPRLEPRILIEDPDKSYHAAQRHSENDIFDNKLIFDDNEMPYLRILMDEVFGRHNFIAQFVNDEWGNPVINPEFNAAMLAEAMCKLEGFDYAPSEDVFWGHDDYSLEIQNLPQAPPEPEDQAEDHPARPRRKFGKSNPAQTTIFDVGGEQ